MEAHGPAGLTDLRPGSQGEIAGRWVEAILDLDQSRHPADLMSPRPLADRVAGCCRDHSLLLASFLRTHGVPARMAPMASLAPMTCPPGMPAPPITTEQTLPQ